MQTKIFFGNGYFFAPSSTIDAAHRQASNVSMNSEFISQPPLNLEALDSYLSSDASPEDCMQLSDLDGFLTAIVIGPELIKPSEWFPIIWGRGAPEFESDEFTELILNAIMGRYNEIIQSLARDPPAFKPIFWQTDDGLVIAGDWAQGFMEAMRLRPLKWAELLDDEEVELLLIPIIAQVGDEEADVILDGGSDEKEMQFLAAAADLIPSSVSEIHAYWKAQRESASESSGRLH